MAGPLNAKTTVDPPGPLEAYKGPLGSLGWALSWLDYAVYTVEHALVVIALITMTLIEFVYILSVYAIEQKITIAQMQNPAIEAEVPLGVFVLLGFVGLLSFSTVNATSLGRKKSGGKRPLGVRLGLTLVVETAVVGISALTILMQESSHFYLMMVLLIMGPTLFYFFKKGQIRATGVLGVVTAIMLYLAYDVPTGYSWADNRALFLLLWVGFLGASMASKQGRHIKLDVARKLCPQKFLPYFNGLSYLVSAAATGFLVYLSYIYMFHEDYGRWWARTIPGELPDWLIVMAIPVAFLVMTCRFAARGVASLMTPVEDSP